MTAHNDIIFNLSNFAQFKLKSKSESLNGQLTMNNNACHVMPGLACLSLEELAILVYQLSS